MRRPGRFLVVTDAAREPVRCLVVDLENPGATESYHAIVVAVAPSYEVAERIAAALDWRERADL